jgi:putative flippase GtrA
MSRWKSESALLTRYAGSGVVNTIAGFGSIFALMRCGASPVVANIGGYVVGLLLSFFLSKKLVFRSDGQFVDEGLRYLIAFAVCFAANLATLRLAINELHMNANLAQLLATLTYTALMYTATRWFVFKPKMSC